MSMLSTMKHGVRGVDLGHGVLGWGLNGAVAAGTGYALAQFYNRYRGKWIGEHSPKMAAGLGKFLSPLLRIFGAPSLVAGAVDSVGQAGLAVLGAEYGFTHSRKALGQQAVMIPATAALPAGATGISRIGELGTAPGGEGLSLSQLEDLRRMP